MLDQYLTENALPMLLAALGGAGICALIGYFALVRPRAKSILGLNERLQELAQGRAISDTENRQAQQYLRDKLDELARGIERRDEQLHQAQAHINNFTRENASLREQLSFLQDQQSQLELVRREVIELNQQRSELQTQLRSQTQQLEQQQAFVEKTKNELRNEFELTANKLFERKSEQFTSASQSLLEGTLTPFKTQLQEFRKKVEDVYEKENAERSRLSGQIVELQKQAHKIGRDAVDLAQALKGSTKTQGGWGEVILERLLEQSGLQKGREYETQLSLQGEDGSRRMPDVVVRLPEGKDIVIDAKVSLTDYERYCNSDSEAQRQEYLNRHIQSLRAHIKGLSAKNYESLPGIRALDFIFIFIPIEAAFMLALQNDQSLYKDAYDRQIILASPTTLLAILRMVDNLWRYDKQNKNAERIARDAGGLHDQFVLWLEALETVGQHIDKAKDAYLLAHKRLSTGRGNLLKRVDGIRKLGAKTKKRIDPARLEESDDLTTTDNTE